MMRNLKDYDLHNKKILLRLDLNVPICAKGTLLDATRITAVLPTLRFLLAKECKIIIISHLGRPDGKYVRQHSLRRIVPFLEKHWDLKIQFCKNVFAIKQLGISNNNKALILCENLRFHREELSNDRVFAQYLASLANIYVNDAFSCSHRKHASIDLITEFIPSAAGFLMEAEVESINTIFLTDHRKKIAIIGGKKITTKLSLLSNLAEEVDKIFIVGAMASSLLKALDFVVGESLCEDFPEVAEIYHKYRDKIVLPVDFIVESNKKVFLRNIQSLDYKDTIYDIGIKSLEAITAAIRNCNLVLWNGPVGLYEQECYGVSSLCLARIIAYETQYKGIFSIIGGGDIVAAVNKTGLAHCFSHVSTGGGAFLEFMAKKEIVGVTKLIKVKSE